MTEYLSAKLSDFGTARTLASMDVASTSVGTPLFAAPEVMQGEAYDEKCDVYSFGMILLDCAVEGNILDFIAERWRKAFKKTVARPQPMRLIRPMVEDGWRPVDEAAGAPHAPPALNELIVRCSAQDPRCRPSFEQVLAALEGPAKAEIDQGAFRRGTVRRSAASGGGQDAQPPAPRGGVMEPPLNQAEKNRGDIEFTSLEDLYRARVAPVPAPLPMPAPPRLIESMAARRQGGSGVSMSSIRRNSIDKKVRPPPVGGSGGGSGDDGRNGDGGGNGVVASPLIDVGDGGEDRSTVVTDSARL